MSPPSLLRRLEALRLEHSAAATAAKRSTLVGLAGAQFRNADLLLRYHEILCTMAAYPDDRAQIVAVRRELRAFARRPDLARFRDELADSGIAGTATRYNFFWMMGRYLAARFPRRYRINWDAREFESRLKAALPLVLPWHEAEAVKRSALPPRAIIERLRDRASDAVFLAQAIERVAGDNFTREHVHDSIDCAYILLPGAGFPSRTLAQHRAAPLAYRKSVRLPGPVDLGAALGRRPHAVHRASLPEARSLIELAREAMLTRARDLAAFSWGDERDVMVIDDGDGLAFALIGSLPERRLPLPVVHGWLMLRNRVPVGYVQTDSLLAGTEVAFNVFPTFRGVEAGHLFSRVLATARHVLGARAFSIEPYQLGVGNDEAIESGAWWFYYMLGFRPSEAEPQRLLARELARMKRRPAHLSSAPTLTGLAAGHMVYEPEKGRRAWLPLVPDLGFARRWATGPAATQAALRRLGAGSDARWPRDERRAWERLAPVVLALPGIDTWSAKDKREALAALRAKGGVREIDFLRCVDAHAPLTTALQRLLGAWRRSS